MEYLIGFLACFVLNIVIGSVLLWLRRRKEKKIQTEGKIVENRESIFHSDEYSQGVCFWKWEKWIVYRRSITGDELLFIQSNPPILCVFKESKHFKEPFFMLQFSSNGFLRHKWGIYCPETNMEKINEALEEGRSFFKNVVSLKRNGNIK